MDLSMRSKFAEKGIKEEHLAKLSALGITFNWPALLMLVGKYGPGLIADLANKTPWDELAKKYAPGVLADLAGVFTAG